MITQIIVIISLIVLSGIFSGLTLGLMSLSTFDLKRKAELGNKYAKKIFPIRKDGNLLLSTLLVGNVLVNSILSIYFGAIFTGFTAVIAATVLITIFGEILPQALCSKHPLKIGAISVPFVKILTFLLYPICKPIALSLDKTLGGDLTIVLSKKELGAIITEHEENGNSNIDLDEKNIIHGALQYSDKEVEDIMTPKKVVFMINYNDIITHELLETIKKTGHTRIPIYTGDKDKIVGILLVKDLINNKAKHIKDLKLRQTFNVTVDTKLDTLLNILISSKQHLAIVRDHYDTVVGVVTMEDIIEEILKREIVDETDNFEDMREQAKTI